MTKLSQIESEARRVLGKLPEHELRGWQTALLALCEQHWAKIRGPRPERLLAATLWDTCPYPADLLVDLDGRADAKLATLLQGRSSARALASLVLLELERGNAGGGRVAYEAMMLCDSEPSRQRHIEAVTALLSGRGPGRRKGHREARTTPLEKAVAAIAAATGRYDEKALLATIELLAETQPGSSDDENLVALFATLDGIGLRFEAVGDGRLEYTQHRTRRKSTTLTQLTDILAQVRGTLV